MTTDSFHNKPFDEGTLTKLRIFELYAQEWLPVFLSADRPSRKRIHLFDFFAGPGTDSSGRHGSPLLLLSQLRKYQRLVGWTNVQISVHLFDESPVKIRKLEENISNQNLRLPGVALDIRPLSFSEAFRESASLLADTQAAKLVFIDQFGVDHVSNNVFQALVSAPTCDFLFFLSSSTLHRFRDHPAIKQKIVRPDDYFHVHRAALDYYRKLLPNTSNYFLAPFSIKKGSNIYGLIFGSAHPLGIDKFLQVAWGKDGVSGEADFDIHRDNVVPEELLLPFAEMKTSKLAAFEGDLERLLVAGHITNEFEIMQICFDYGVKRQHATPVLSKLKREGLVDLDFKVPDVRRWNSPRQIFVKAP